MYDFFDLYIVILYIIWQPIINNKLLNLKFKIYFYKDYMWEIKQLNKFMQIMNQY